LFDLYSFYSTYNKEAEESYTQSVIKIKEILNQLEESHDSEKKEYLKFLISVRQLIIKLCDFENNSRNPNYYKEKSFEELLALNNAFYCELLPENYSSSYANPSYCVKIFGEKEGQLFSWFYLSYRQYITYAAFHKIYKMADLNTLYIEVYDYIKNNPVDFIHLKELMTRYMLKKRPEDEYYNYKEQHDPDFRYLTNILTEDDLNDLRYLFKSGTYISENEIKIAKFMQNYPVEKLKILAKEIIRAYYKGFVRDNKDVTIKETVGFYYKIGLERLYREMIKEFKSQPHPLETCIINAYSTRINEQYDFDHKFDNALYISEEYIEKRIEEIQYGLEENKDLLDKYSGIMYIEKFGDPLFSPESKKDVLKLSPEQQKLQQTFQMRVHQLINQYIPQAKTSFCMVAFPTPKIGEQFEEIFEETIKINMFDSEKYEKIQQIMIDTLDQADYVHIKGRGMNKTNLKIQLQQLKDPSKSTNFVNSGSSVNIPGGEIFTAPQLNGTTGLLHVEETYQNSLRYDNLQLEFSDGYISAYSCTNFKTEEENQKYIEENLLFPHKTLPIGEFAIGTNTLAYKVSREYDIVNLLPILISEKTGPHFALGDTCFSRSEDQKMYNQFTKKLICAMDNEKSRLRHKTPTEAYSNKHEDIVMDFSAIDFIAAVLSNGKTVDIIRDGRFSLPGTEELNIPLEEMGFK